MHNYSTWAVYFLIALLAPLAAQAQSYDAPTSGTADTAAGYNWQGAYAGLAVGGNGGTARRDFSAGNPNTTGDFGTGGIIGGGTVGYNWQLPSVVLGVEGDFSGSGISGHAACPNAAATCHVDNDWLATLRPRIGLPLGQFMPYATGGLAVGAIHSHSNNNATDATGTDFTDVKAGWALGGGVEMPVADHLTFKAEYLYVQLADAEGPSDSTNHALDGAPSYVHFDANIGRVGFNYHF